MSITLMFFLALGLAMDAAAVSVANGIVHPRRPIRLGLACGLAFGFFQAMMPLAGYLAGATFMHIISGFDHWISLAILCFIGGRMIVQSTSRSPIPAGTPLPRRLSPGSLISQAFATSVDALAVGLGLGSVEVDITRAVLMIGAVTFACSFLGVQLGRAVGSRHSSRALFLGGCVLVLIGLHIFIEHIF